MKFKGKDIFENVAQASNATTIAPGLYKLDPVTLGPKDNNKRETHIYYLKHTMKQVAILKEIVEQAKSLNPLDSASYSSSKKKEEMQTYKKSDYLNMDITRDSTRTCTLVGNVCPLTRITATNKVPFREPIPLEVITQEYIVTKVYTRRPKVVQIVLWYLDSGCSKHMTGDRSQLTNFVHKFLGTVKSGNNQITKIMGKLYLLHMDLCGPMRVASVNRKKYILVIVDDYSLFTWVKFLALNDEAPDFIIKFLKMIQVILNATVRNIRTDNGTEFLTAMASEQLGLGPGLQSMTPATSSSGLVPNPILQQPCNPPPKDDWDRLFQPMLDEYFNPPRIVDLVDSPVSTSIDQDAPSTKSSKIPHFHDDPLHESLHEDSTSQGSSSNVRPIHTPFESLGRWTKDHPISNVISDPSCAVSTRKKLQTDTMWCYFDTFLTLVKTDEFGGVLKNKARLVAQGFRNEEGIDYEELLGITFS
ncbi:retrovirus-related pol polyprotein from transposon TNT 1-94 [Tanacetum coccineum]